MDASDALARRSSAVMAVAITLEVEEGFDRRKLLLVKQ
jgi:hypothetical protein